MPASFMVSQNFPNPFNPDTKIQFALPEETHVQLEIYNVNGEKIAVLLNAKKDAGYHNVFWDGKNGAGKSVSGGLYLCRIHAGDYRKTIRMLLVK